MCTGRVDLAFVIRAFQKGADGVIIGGCWPGECHYVTEGNYDALCNVHLGKKLLAAVGLEPERLRIAWIGASEGAQFAEIMSDFSRQMTALGPSDQTELPKQLEAISNLIPYIKLVQREKLRPPTRKEPEINAFFQSAEADRAFDALIADKLTPEPMPVPEASPCQLACPIGTQAWRYVAHIERGEYEQAYVAIREANPFPSVCARVCDHRCEKGCRLAAAGEAPVAIRALKRFITDTIDPSVYQVARLPNRSERVAIVGAGPAGLTAAHLLSLRGYRVTLFDANDKPGGMLRMGIPAYRLPRDVLDREINALLNDNITKKMGHALGEEITIDGLFEDGFNAVFLALGSIKSMPLRIDGEQSTGVYPSLRFLSEFNLRGVSLAKGKVGVIGGGNSAIDAARIALRQTDVDEVTIIYRRSRGEMPAYDEEIDAAIEEGAILKPLLSPVSIKTEDGALVGLECIQNELGAPDAGGRRRPVPIDGTERVMPLDTLIVAVGEKPEIDCVRRDDEEESPIQKSDWGSLTVDPRTHATSRRGLFAGGDVVTGPNTVVDAIAAGKRAAVAIDRYLSDEALDQPGDGARLGRYQEPAPERREIAHHGARLSVPHVPVGKRRVGFTEVELAVTEEVARREAGRCLRCDRDAKQALSNQRSAVSSKKG